MGKNWVRALWAALLRRPTTENDDVVDNDDWFPRADILMNDRLIAINSLSGYSLLSMDNEVPEYLLPPDVEDSILGSSALAALKDSRYFSWEVSRKFREGREEKYQAWVERLMQYGGYKEKQLLFRHMKHCSFAQKSDQLLISPWHHEKQEAWSGIANRDGSTLEFSLPLESSPEEVGAAIRLGFAHCTGR